ncbi:uncharacterized protein LOC141729946 [Zonotrichia albicollis]|uniref:uncharacterized protein LOC141729946 n=1 Tax=Zonotrichia albicollis TaxID=44394 RepID=UPI003D80DC8F
MKFTSCELPLGKNTPKPYTKSTPLQRRKKRPFIKTEYNYINDEDMDPHITTKQTPFSATELAKLKKEFGRLPHESETEYVFRVSLTGGDQIKLTEQEASGYWGHGVFLTTGDKRDAWSLTQRAAYWAGGINPLERGDPLAIATTPDQILESVQKAACLQMIHEKKLIRGFESPMQLPVKPEIMTPLIRGLPETLKSTAITIQKTVMALSPIDRLERFLNNSTDQSDSSRKIWTWSEVAVDLINYCRQYGPAVKRPVGAAGGPKRLERIPPPLSRKLETHCRRLATATKPQEALFLHSQTQALAGAGRPVKPWAGPPGEAETGSSGVAAASAGRVLEADAALAGAGGPLGISHPYLLAGRGPRGRL